MVSGGTVNGDLSSLKSSLSSYSSEISGLSGSWTGASHDGIVSKCEAFVSEYTSTISGQMSAFASACDLYQDYVNCKNELNTAQSNYNTAVSNKDSSAMTSYGNQVASCKAKLASLKSQIESLLSTASSGKLEATSVNATTTTSGDSSSTTTTTTTTTTAAGQNPNYIYSTKCPGYVFPFEKGVNAPVSSHVGKRKAPTAGASTNHQGTDIAAAKGTEIHAIYGGTVVTSGSFGGYGNCVRVQQDDGNLTYYAHCSSTSVREGDRVEAGDVVGKVGSTGVATGPHLHLEIRASDYTDKNKHLLDSEQIFEGVWPQKA